METSVEERRGTRPGRYWGRTGEVAGTVRIITGVLPSGVPFTAETFEPDRTEEERAEWEKRMREACREFVRGSIRENGYERARERLAVQN